VKRNLGCLGEKQSDHLGEKHSAKLM